MTVKTQFSIKDLENLSGVKAHTIRIWEKRYGLLNPERTNTNIRQYDLINLRKLLNVTFLYNSGYKISKIAELGKADIQEIIGELSVEQEENFAIQNFKSAMFDFDYSLFAATFEQLKKSKTFGEIFFDVFIPLLNEIGLLWQTGTIDPSHERFISELIKQKLILNIEAKQREQVTRKKPVFVLYLPYEEIHEIGLLYTNYEILSAGYHSIYLGNHIPISSLTHVLKHHEEFVFLSYLTVKPDKVSVEEYLNQFHRKIILSKKRRLWLMGAKIAKLELQKKNPHVSLVRNIEELHAKLKTLRKSQN